MKPEEEHKETSRSSLSGTGATLRPTTPRLPLTSTTPRPAANPPQPQQSDQSKDPQVSQQMASGRPSNQKPSIRQQQQGQRERLPPLRSVHAQGQPVHAQGQPVHAQGQPAQTDSDTSMPATARLAAAFPGMTREEIECIVKIFNPTAANEPSRDGNQDSVAPARTQPRRRFVTLPPTPLVHPLPATLPREEPGLPPPYRRSILDVLNVPRRKRYFLNSSCDFVISQISYWKLQNHSPRNLDTQKFP